MNDSDDAFIIENWEHLSPNLRVLCVGIGVCPDNQNNAEISDKTI